MKKYIKKLIRNTSLYRRMRQLEKKQSEILMGLYFNNTIMDSEWLKYKNFSPGGWAADYGLLCTLYRVLDGIKPKSIVEFGLGQTSKMIHQFANFYNVYAITFEHDKSWVKFFEESINGRFSVKVHLTELENTIYKGFETLTYKNVSRDLEGSTFDFVLVDGQYGCDHFSRSEILGIVQNNLRDHFCIIIDDTEREGEHETVLEIIDFLNKRNKDFCWREYSSTKSHTLICSADYRFLTSL